MNSFLHIDHSTSSIMFRRNPRSPPPQCCGEAALTRRHSFVASAQEGNAPARDLLRQVAGDCVAGIFSAAIVAPAIAAVDKALAENASGRADLKDSLITSVKELCLRPQRFFTSPAYLWLWFVYSATYSSANLVMTWAEQTKKDPGVAKFFITSSVNMTTCIAKDQAFAKMFGEGPAKATPAGSYACWFLRDTFTIAAAFTLPDVIGPIINPENPRAGVNTAQIVLPLALQTVNTPLHLLGYDWYNNPNNTLRQRVNFILGDYWRVIGIRVIRTAPPYSFGTILNRESRSDFQDRFGA